MLLKLLIHYSCMFLKLLLSTIANLIAIICVTVLYLDPEALVVEEQSHINTKGKTFLATTFSKSKTVAPVKITRISEAKDENSGMTSVKRF